MDVADAAVEKIGYLEEKVNAHDTQIDINTKTSAFASHRLNGLTLSVM